MNYSDIFNPGTLNIFTDASIKTIGASKNSESLGGPGAVCVYTHEDGGTSILDQSWYVERYATNNSAEIKAISLGISKAVQYSNRFNKINLFSDSMICVHGLREWMFNWVNCIGNDGNMYSSSGKPVANQSTFTSIVNTILHYNLNISLYHQKGHVTTSNPSSVDNAIRVFKKTNKISSPIDYNLMKCLSDWNNYIDVRTGEILENINLSECDRFTKDTNPMKVDMSSLDIERYKELIGKKRSSRSFFERG